MLDGDALSVVPHSTWDVSDAGAKRRDRLPLITPHEAEQAVVSPQHENSALFRTK
jgi:hypothetical protein